MSDPGRSGSGVNVSGNEPVRGKRAVIAVGGRAERFGELLGVFGLGLRLEAAFEGGFQKQNSEQSLVNGDEGVQSETAETGRPPVTDNFALTPG